MTSYIHSFTLHIGKEFIPDQSVVHVAYKLWYNGKITDIHTNYPLEVPGNIKDWEGFKEHVKQACETNSKTKKLPGNPKGNSFSKLDDPVELHYYESYQVYK